MGANIAGIYGAQIFRSDDRPRYRRAFSVACAVLAFGLALAIVRYVDDIIRRRRNARKLSETPATSEYATIEQLDREKNANPTNLPPPSDDQPGPLLIENDLKPVASQNLRTKI